MSRTALPVGVHRASTAYYFGMPGVAVLQQRSLLILIESSLRSATQLRAPHPVLQTILAECNAAAVQRRLRRWSTSAASMKAESPFDRFAVAAQHFDVVSLLPRTAAGLVGWRAEPLIESIATNTNTHVARRLLLEAHGHELSHTAATYGSVLPGAGTVRGTMPPPLLGLPSAPRTVDQLEALAATLPAGPMPSLLIDEPEHAMRRTRVALNRESTWLAVRHARSKKTPAEAPRHCTACAPASGPPQAETAMHVIAHCPR